MKASLFYGAHDIRIGEMNDAEPGPGEILLDVTAVGICGSDLHNYIAGNIGGVVNLEPLVLGHEASGRVVAVGPGVDKQKFRPGQLVAIDPATPCGVCEFCEAGDPQLCIRLKFMGLFPDHGAMRERMVHPAKSCVVIPEGISEASAALLEPLGVAYHAMRHARVRVEDDVLVIGTGAIGLLIIRLARLAGARRIIAVDHHPWRMDLAASFGADVLLDYTKADVVEAVMRLTNKRGVDVAIEAAWVKDTAAQCAEAVRHGGNVVIVGIPMEDELKVRASTVRRKELNLITSRRMKHTYPPGIELVASGRVDLDRIATHRFPLDNIKTAFDVASEYQDNVVRAMIYPQMKP